MHNLADFGGSDLLVLAKVGGLVGSKKSRYHQELNMLIYLLLDFLKMDQ